MSEAYTDLVDALREIAADLDHLIEMDLPAMRVSLSLQPADHAGVPEEQRIAVVDTVASALVGIAGETSQLSGGTWHHTARGRRGPVNISVFCAVDDPGAKHVHAEVLRLRARVAELEGRGDG